MMNNDIFFYRIYKFIQERIKYYSLTLSDKIIYTEFGSDSYLYTPIIALLSNAKKVYAINKDSEYGKFEDNKEKLQYLIKLFELDNKRLIMVNEKKKEDLQECDIVTNSGFVRPIDKETLSYLKETAVIPLMWETWEFRESDIDLEYAKKREILVLGTNEANLGLSIFNYRGFLVSKLFFDCNMGLYDDKVLLVGSGRLGKGIANFFRATNVDFNWIMFDNINEIKKSHEKYLIDQEFANNNLEKFDAIIFAEHFYNKVLLGNDDSIINISKLYKNNPYIQLIHICGNIDIKELNKYIFSIHPKSIKPFGYMSVNGSYLSPKSAIELITAGFKVGEIMSNNRKKYNFKQAYLKSIENKLVDDFKGGYIE
jgi:hypothetical protein